MNASEKLKALREQKGMSQADCAKAMNIDRTTYAKYENGGSIRRNVEKLASFFNVSVDYLLGRTDEPGGAAGLQKDTPLDSHLVMTSNVLGDSDTDDIQRRYSQLDEAGKAAVKNLISIFENAKKTNQ